MYPVFESVKVVNSRICLFESHLERMERTSIFLWNKPLNFPLLKEEIEAKTGKGLQKCRVSYSNENYLIDSMPYTKRTIQKLHLIQDNDISYSCKMSDRNCFNIYTQGLKSDEDILIVKNNLLTDSSYSNIALWNGNEWHTPATPLLKGTKREHLMKQGILKEVTISTNHLDQYSKISLINAMLELGETEIDMQSILPF